MEMIGAIVEIIEMQFLCRARGHTALYSHTSCAPGWEFKLHTSD